MTHNIQSNYMVPWKAVKSLPPVYLTGLLVPQTGRALEPGSVNLHSLWQYRMFVPSCIFCASSKTRTGQACLSVYVYPERS